MADEQEKRYTVNAIRRGGWGLYEIKRSLTIPIAVLAQSDDRLADLICDLLNTGHTIADIKAMEAFRAAYDGESSDALNVDQFLTSLSKGGG